MKFSCRRMQERLTGIGFRCWTRVASIWVMLGLLVGVAGLVTPTPAEALVVQLTQTRLFGTTGFGGSPSTLIEIDPNTGTVLQVIGPIGYSVNGLTFDPASGKLYAGTSWNDPSYNGLIEIDPNSGTGTPVGLNHWGVVKWRRKVRQVYKQ